MVVRKFLRRTWTRYSKLGRKRKNKQRWRKPIGRHNKMRLKRKAYPAVVGIGYRQQKKEILMKVNNLSDLEKTTKGQTIIIGKIGQKKKLEIMNEATKKGIKVYKINTHKFIKNKSKKNESK